MRISNRIWGLCLLVSVIVPCCLHAEQWMRGALCISGYEGDAQVEPMGGQPLDLQVSGAEQYVSAAVRLRAALGGELFLRASNRFAWALSGPGVMGVERFEQQVFEGRSLSGAEQSRMILNLRRGLVVADSRELSPVSRLIIETPVGRISADSALWYMDVAYEKQKQIYNFVFECSDGVIRYTDLRGEIFVLRAGQRLSGAGSVATPSIEVSEASHESVESFDVFREKAEAFKWEDTRPEAFFEKMKLINVVSAAAGTTSEAGGDEARGARPIVIEYVPRPELQIPFRGELQPIRNLEDELF